MQSPDEGTRVEVIFGKGVKEMRAKRNWSQQALAERLDQAGLNIDSSGVSRIENGTRALRLSEALLVASALDIDLDWLLRPAPTPDVSERIEEAVADVRRDHQDLTNDVERLAQSREWLESSVIPDENDPESPAVTRARARGREALTHYTFAEAVRVGVLQYVANGPGEVEAMRIVAEAGGVQAYVQDVTGLEVPE